MCDGWTVGIADPEPDRPSFPLQNKATKWVHWRHDEYAQIVNVSVTLSSTNGWFSYRLFAFCAAGEATNVVKHLAKNWQIDSRIRGRTKQRTFAKCAWVKKEVKSSQPEDTKIQMYLRMRGSEWASECDWLLALRRVLISHARHILVFALGPGKNVSCVASSSPLSGHTSPNPLFTGQTYKLEQIQTNTNNKLLGAWQQKYRYTWTCSPSGRDRWGEYSSTLAEMNAYQVRFLCSRYSEVILRRLLNIFSALYFY